MKGGNVDEKDLDTDPDDFDEEDIEKLQNSSTIGRSITKTA